MSKAAVVFMFVLGVVGFIVGGLVDDLARMENTSTGICISSFILVMVSVVLTPEVFSNDEKE